MLEQSLQAVDIGADDQGLAGDCDVWIAGDLGDSRSQAWVGQTHEAVHLRGRIGRRSLSAIHNLLPVTVLERLGFVLADGAVIGKNG